MADLNATWSVVPQAVAIILSKTKDFFLPVPEIGGHWCGVVANLFNQETQDERRPGLVVRTFFQPTGRGDLIHPPQRETTPLGGVFVVSALVSRDRSATLHAIAPHTPARVR